MRAFLLLVAASSLGQVTYDADILPRVLGPFCLSCHGSTSGTGGRRFHTYELATSNGAHIRANARIQQGTMPPSGPLAPDLQALFQQWIDDGALETASAQSPMAVAGADITVDEGDEVFLNGANSTDLDGTIVNHSWQQLSGPTVVLGALGPGVTSFNAPLVGATQVLTFRLTVTDNDGLTDTDDISVTVQDINPPPIANAGIDQTVEEGAAVLLDGTGSNDDGTINAFSWTQQGGPVVSLQNASTATPSYLAPEVSGSALMVWRLVVTDDGGAQHSDTVSITVVDANLPPLADPGPNLEVQTSSTVALDATGSADPDGFIAAWLWTRISGPAVLISDANSATPTFSAPSFESTLILQLTITDDDGASTTAQVSVGVFSAAGSPTADAGSDREIGANFVAELDASGSSGNGPSVKRLAWEQQSGPAVELTNSDQAIAEFVAPGSGSLRFRLTVEDSLGRIDTDTVTLTTLPSHPVSLRRGWNLISFPLDLSVDVELPPRTWRWIGSTHELVLSNQALQSRYGAWILSPHAQTVEAFGTAPAGKVSSQAGAWSLFGPVNPVQVPAGASVCWQWDDVGYRRLAADAILQPGTGYWLYFEQAAEIDLGED